jgi:RimJ/RimL family protein N-acetyltransferase
MTTYATIETTRLRLRPRVLADLDANLAMDLDPEVHRFLFAEPPDPSMHRDQIRSRIIAGWPEIGGLWVVEYREARQFLGWCGLFPLEQSGMIEIGYRFVRGAWGHGIATESAATVLDHGFRALGIDPIVAVVHPDNVRSLRVIEKIGLLSQGSAHHYGRELVFYRLSRSAYLARSMAQSL